jgi:hypothetical protein
MLPISIERKQEKLLLIVKISSIRTINGNVQISIPKPPNYALINLHKLNTPIMPAVSWCNAYKIAKHLSKLLKELV